MVTKKEAEEFDSDLEVGRQFAGALGQGFRTKFEKLLAGAIGRAFVWGLQIRRHGGVFERGFQRSCLYFQMSSEG